MSTPHYFAFPTLKGPSRSDLILALFDRKSPEPLTFIASDNGNKVIIHVRLKGLIQGEQNSWEIIGTLLDDSPLDPSGRRRPLRKIVCTYNDHTFEGILRSDGTDTD